MHHRTADVQTNTSTDHSQGVIPTHSHKKQCDISRDMIREGLEDLILPVCPWIHLSKFYFNVLRLDYMISKASEQKVRITALSL